MLWIDWLVSCVDVVDLSMLLLLVLSMLWLLVLSMLMQMEESKTAKRIGDGFSSTCLALDLCDKKTVYASFGSREPGRVVIVRSLLPHP